MDSSITPPPDPRDRLFRLTPAGERAVARLEALYRLTPAGRRAVARLIRAKKKKRRR